MKLVLGAISAAAKGVAGGTKLDGKYPYWVRSYSK